MHSTENKNPNILITGTPGTGKSSLAEELVEKFGFEFIQVSELAKEKECFDGYDEELQCPYLDEDKILDELEDPIKEGGKIIEYHSSEFFPERFFDGVFVLRCNNTVLHDRLKTRGYNEHKVLENIQCEIMNVSIDEARDSYKEEIVFELQSSTVDEMEANIQTVVNWIEDWRRKAGSGDSEESLMES